MVAKTLDLIKMLLDREMNMPENRVWAYNSNIELPKDSELFIVLQLPEKTPVSNNIKYKPTDKGLNEVQSMTVQEKVIISLMSRNTTARDRAHEALFALNSTYSQQLQTQNAFHVNTISPIIDMSFLEETSMFNRYDIRVKVIRGYDKIKAVEYYDKFPDISKVETEITIEE